MASASLPGAAGGLGARRWLAMLARDPLACLAALFLLLLVLAALLGPALIPESAGRMNLRLRNAPPFELANGWLYILGADTLGRSMLARLIEASRSTLMVASSAVALSFLIGGTLGVLAGYARGWGATLILRMADVLMSFPSLLLAVVVLYTFSPSIKNIVLVLAITRLPVYIRTARAEILELRERMFVSAARVMGAGPIRTALRHVVPFVLPTLLTLAAVDFAYVMLAESALSFLGIGIQPPDVTWGLMVAQGRGYLASAWWLAFFPGLFIMLTTLSLNLLASWLRVAADPQQRWRLEPGGKAGDAP
ncbi:ABC transporter permease [Marinimicrococcus flavescens]|uniref:ABC transporter permease n=1 Tax=Marinimicrococcus flavescens TaxID=3031815 RepID=A0AAP3XPL9_9PROT|nr:ABC transporter permease [Marinimicrococcus flavescens]